jgi:hypothetical protein
LSRSESERQLAAIVAAQTKWGRCENRAEATKPARDAFNQRFLDEASGDPVRAANLRKAHFARLALESVKARRKIKELTAEAFAAEAELAGGDA